MTALHLYLLRHGEPVTVDQFYGHADVALSPRGEEQAAAAARALARVSLAAIYSSDLERASYGARLLAAGASDRPAPVALAELREMHLGTLERQPIRDARARVPELAGRRYEDMLDFRMPGGGESVLDLAARVLPCVSGLVARHARPNGVGQATPAIAIVAHNTVNRVLLACAAGLGVTGYMRFEQAFGAINRVDVRDGWSDADLWSATRIALTNWTPAL